MRDEIIPTDKWEFNKDVSDCFDDMIARSIPDYSTMRDLTLRVADYYLKHYVTFNMLDVGCSNGINLEMFINQYGIKGNYMGIDTSEDMIQSANERLEKYKVVKTLACDDINKILIAHNHYHIVTSILTLQFVPIDYRPAVLKKIYNAIRKDGVFILVEKTYQSNFEYNDMFVQSYYDIKQKNNYTCEQIETKRKALEGVLVPSTTLGNIEMLKNAGFKTVTKFWQALNFEGYIAKKGDIE